MMIFSTDERRRHVAQIAAAAATRRDAQDIPMMRIDEYGAIMCVNKIEDLAEGNSEKARLAIHYAAARFAYIRGAETATLCIPEIAREALARADSILALVGI